MYCGNGRVVKPFAKKSVPNSLFMVLDSPNVVQEPWVGEMSRLSA